MTTAKELPAGFRCRMCSGRAGKVVLDLGRQPACDYFPAVDQPGPDPTHPLQMWFCPDCRLAQLAADPGAPNEPLATEPGALVSQAVAAVAAVAAAGWLAGRRTVTEYGSPHGGSWLGLLEGRGMTGGADGAPTDVVLDCFGMMHEPDQSAALAERTARVSPDGVLLLQYHSLEAILRLGQWNALRHGHYAYYSTTAVTLMLQRRGFSARRAWHFDLYGGTVLLAATRGLRHGGDPDPTVRTLLDAERSTGVCEADVLRSLQRRPREWSTALRAWLVEERDRGHRPVGYGAASRAVALLLEAGIDRGLLPAVLDVSRAKHGRRMPGTDIPILDPVLLEHRPPRSVLLFLPDLLDEVRAAYPQVEAAGGEWVTVEALAAAHAQDVAPS